MFVWYIGTKTPYRKLICMDGVAHRCSPKTDNDIHNLNILIAIYAIVCIDFLPFWFAHTCDLIRTKTNDNIIILTITIYRYVHLHYGPHRFWHHLDLGIQYNVTNTHPMNTSNICTTKHKTRPNKQFPNKFCRCLEMVWFMLWQFSQLYRQYPWQRITWIPVLPHLSKTEKKQVKGDYLT